MNGRRGSGCRGRADGVVSTKGTSNGVVVNDAQRNNGVWDICGSPSLLTGSTSPLFFGSVFRDPFLPGIHRPPFETLTRLYSDTSARTDGPPARIPMRDARPPLGTSRSFDDVPISPLCDGVRSSSVFSHVPLEHEIVASRSVWGGAAGDYGRGGRRGVTEAMVLRRGSSATAAGARSGIVGASRNERAEDPLGLGVASKVTLVETLVDLGAKAGPGPVVDEVSFPTEAPGDREKCPSGSERGTGDDICESSDYIARSRGAAGFIASTPSAGVVTHATLARVQRPGIPTPSAILESFDIPIPIFPFPAGTTRCTNRDCPIKHRHERGPYLHDGKLRTRKGSVFGASNPPPEVWFLYDVSGHENFRGGGGRAFAPVELFVRYHFGESRGGCGGGRSGVGGGGPRGGKGGGKMARFWRVWG